MLCQQNPIRQGPCRSTNSQNRVIGVIILIGFGVCFVGFFDGTVNCRIGMRHNQYGSIMLI